MSGCWALSQQRTNQAGADGWLSGTDGTMQSSPRTAPNPTSCKLRTVTFQFMTTVSGVVTVAFLIYGRRE